MSDTSGKVFPSSRQIQEIHATLQSQKDSDSLVYKFRDQDILLSDDDGSRVTSVD
jgi:hypothetical protein